MRKILNAIDYEALRQIISADTPELASVAIGLAWLGGLSRHEMWELRWEDVDVEPGVLHVQGREVPIGKDLAGLLARWREAAASGASPEYVLALKTKGTRPVESSLSPKVRAALDEAGLNDISLASLRNDYICRAFDDNDAAQAMRMTGIALSTYRHIYKKEGSAEIAAPPRYAEQEAAERLWDVLQRNREGCVGIALWLTQMIGLTEQEVVNLTWEQYDEKRGVLNLKRGSLMLTTELIALLNKEHSARMDTDDAHILLAPKKRNSMSVSQVSEMIRQVLIREGLDGHTVPSFRRNSLAESQRSRIRDEVLRKGYITRAVAQQVLGVSAKVASTRLTELVENGDLARTGRSFVPAGLGVASEKWEEIVMELAERRGEVRIVEVAYLLHISKSTARRYLLKMAEEGTLLYERERRRFRLPLEAEGVRERRQENEID